MSERERTDQGEEAEKGGEFENGQKENDRGERRLGVRGERGPHRERHGETEERHSGMAREGDLCLTKWKIPQIWETRKMQK
jgi:hypothetical protein